MDPHTIDVLIAAAFILLVLVALLFTGSIIPLISQALRTLVAYEKLADTLKAEVPATFHEFRELAEHINILGSATTQKVSDVGHKVEEVSGSIGQIADQAKKQTSMWGYGLLEGIKSYLKHDPNQS